LNFNWPHACFVKQKQCWNRKEDEYLMRNST
jgi:hypothetical protein